MVLAFGCGYGPRQPPSGPPCKTCQSGPWLGELLEVTGFSAFFLFYSLHPMRPVSCFIRQCPGQLCHRCLALHQSCVVDPTHFCWRLDSYFHDLIFKYITVWFYRHALFCWYKNQHCLTGVSNFNVTKSAESNLCFEDTYCSVRSLWYFHTNYEIPWALSLYFATAIPKVEGVVPPLESELDLLQFFMKDIPKLGFFFFHCKVQHETSIEVMNSNHVSTK